MTKQETNVARKAESVLDTCDELVGILQRFSSTNGSDGLPSPGEIALALQLALDIRAGLGKGVVRFELAKHVISAIAYVVSRWLQNS